jgi:hypothetical protein
MPERKSVGGGACPEEAMFVEFEAATGQKVAVNPQHVSYVEQDPTNPARTVLCFHNRERVTVNVDYTNALLMLATAPPTSDQT